MNLQIRYQSVSHPILRLSLVVLFGVSTSSCVNPVRFWSESSRQATNVALKEYGPEAVNRKYQWLKEAREALDQKKANIAARQAVLQELEANYSEVSRSEWAKSDLTEYNLARSELTGSKEAYNNLAAQYNAEIKKVTVGIANYGVEPPTGFDGLPTEYAPYTEG